MKKLKQLFAVLCLPVLFACQHRNKTQSGLPSRVYHYASIDTAALTSKHAVYVPVYSHIYTEDGTTTINLGATLSVRNTSYADSFYVTDVVYYGSQGEVLKRYLASPVIVKPMSSVEFVVERVESEGGAGANFVVRWGAAKNGIEPLIQTVMIESAFGISFVTNGIEIK